MGLSPKALDFLVVPMMHSFQSNPTRLPIDVTPSAIGQLRSSMADCLEMSQASIESVQLGPTALNLASAIASPGQEQEAAGALSARWALAQALQSWQQQPVHADGLYLTSSSAQSYQLLFRLLGQPGDKVVLATPHYPLLSTVIALSDMIPVGYTMDWQDRGWQIDRSSFLHALQGARFCILVCPDHPTGACPDEQTLTWMTHAVAAAGVVWIWDEVFAPYQWDEHRWPQRCQLRQNLCSDLGDKTPILYSLGGMAKYAGMTHLKISWIQQVAAPQASQEALHQGLIYLLDTYLTVATPSQQLVPQALAQAPKVQREVRALLQHHRMLLQQWLAPRSMLTWLACPAGWMAVVKIPQYPDEETVVRSLLEHQQLFVHPGYFYDFPQRGILVTSLLMPTSKLGVGWQRLFEGFDRLWPK